MKITLTLYKNCIYIIIYVYCLLIKIFKLVIFIAMPYTKLGTANSIQSTWKWKGFIWRWFCYLVCQGKNEARSSIWEPRLFPRISSNT